MEDKLNEEFRAEVREALKELRYDVKMLIGFRAWLFGACAAISAVVSLGLTYLKK